MKIFLIPTLLFFLIFSVNAQDKQPPIMGWSSWNHFKLNINEDVIKAQADAMVESGLYDAGYRFINIDDGYFGGRDAQGNLLIDTTKFPSGMRNLVDYIHQKELKAGIYTDAGKNTCGYYSRDKDKNGYGVGIYGHIPEDVDLFFNQWNFDFLKVDWCGAEAMRLDEETEYLNIYNAIKKIDKSINYNICRWAFPGKWAIDKADSWRISYDIFPKFSRILYIIEKNANLYPYASSGHYNDMDMLEVGNGMTYDEDKSHFSMWCMMNSPLMTGNNLKNMSKQTLEILTNKELIALNQDEGFKQVKRIIKGKKVDVWVKPLGKNSDQFAIAIFNKSNKSVDYTLYTNKIGIE